MDDAYNDRKSGQVLSNLPGLTDSAELAAFERRMAGYRIGQILIPSLAWFPSPRFRPFPLGARALGPDASRLSGDLR